MEWSAEEDEILRKLYATHGAQYVAALLGRASKSTAERARRLGIAATDLQRTWSDEETEYLRRHYSRAALPKIARKLKRSIGSVYGKARMLGLGSA